MVINELRIPDVLLKRFFHSAPAATANAPTRLQCLDVPIVDEQDCEDAYPGMISRRMVCAGYMDGGRDACNVSFAVKVADTDWIHRPVCVCVEAFITCSLCRGTPAALWCVPERSRAWCHGVRDVLSPTTLECTSKCVSSSPGFKTPWRPTPEEMTRFSFTFLFTIDPHSPDSAFLSLSDALSLLESCRSYIQNLPTCAGT